MTEKKSSRRETGERESESGIERGGAFVSLTLPRRLRYILDRPG